jgi:hypothetical protein
VFVCISDASALYPNVEQIKEHCRTSAAEFVEVIMTYPVLGVMGTKYKELLADLKAQSDAKELSSEWDEFLGIVHSAITENVGEKKILLPSALVELLTANCEKLLTDLDKRKDLCKLLQGILKCESKLCHLFTADYVMLLVKRILIFLSSCLRVRDNPVQNVERNVTLDHEDLETIHYISGSVVRAYYRKGCRFTKSAGWKKILNVITDRLLESDSVEGPPAIVKGWTNAMNKGKLFFVSCKLFNFFVGVAQILEKVTSDRLKVDHDLVIESVCQGVNVLLWDEAVGDYLSESASYSLMCGMIHSFCNTYGVGRAKKLINKFRHCRAEASIALRPSVAPKK